MYLKANLKSRIIANSPKIIQIAYVLLKQTGLKSNENQKKKFFIRDV